MDDFGSGSLATIIIHLADDHSHFYYEPDPIEVSYLPVDYYEYIKSPKWKARADAARKWAEYKCQMDSATGRLSVHHNTYDNLGHEKDRDLIVLCRKCHEKFHDILPKPPKSNWDIF